MKLVKTFKDEQQIYFLMELVQGLDLFDVMREVHLIDEQTSTFYISCLMLILSYLHENRIVYRDLKPENIMIDEAGYPKLIDFGTAKIIENRTYTVLGTPHYMAPEVINGTGYSIEADYWSLGIILYEFLYFNVPFAAEESDTYKIYKEIQENEPEFPNLPNTKNSVNIIKKLLSKTPAFRGNYESIMKNSWFDGVNWGKLLAKQIPAPYSRKAKICVEDLKKAEKSFQEEEKSESIKESFVSDDWDEDF